MSCADFLLQNISINISVLQRLLSAFIKKLFTSKSFEGDFTLVSNMEGTGKKIAMPDGMRCVVNVLAALPMESTLKFLNFPPPEDFAVIYLKFKKRGQNFIYFVKKMPME